MKDKKQDFNDKVVVGMDGQLESAVVAYLLKKQGHQVIGITVQLAEKDIDYKITSLQNGDLDKIKEICDSLEIPFFAADAKDKFKDRVLDRIVTAKISGYSFEPLPHRNQIILDTLLEKANKLGADRVATGHYAKISLNQKSGLFSLHTANDDKNDETYGIAPCGQALLSRLLLPFSEIRRIEVEKIGALLTMEISKDDKKPLRREVMSDDNLHNFVAESCASSLLGEGSIVNYFDGSTLCDHLGIENYQIGQKKVIGKEKFAIDAKMEVIKINHIGNAIFVDNRQETKHTHIQLTNLIVDPALDLTKPILCYAKNSPDSDKKAVIMEFKNNDTAILTYPEDQEGLCPYGSYFVLYNRLGLSAKVIASGESRIAGHLREGHLKVLPETKEEKEKMASLKPEPRIEKLRF